MPAHTSSHLTGSIRRHVWQSVSLPLTSRAVFAQVRRTKAYGLSGTAHISNLLTVNKVPASRRVLAFDTSVLAIGPVQECRSGADGVYTMPWLNPDRQYILLGLDDQGQYSAAASGPVTPTR